MKNTIWHKISSDRIKKDDFYACIEIPKGSKNKYELDKQTGFIVLDRVLYASMAYPANYGFIPKTHSEDGDPLDVLVLCQEVLHPLVLVRAKPIGIIEMIDENKKDEKIIAVPFGDPSYSCYNDIKDLPYHIFEEIKHFFSVYKQLEHKQTEVDEILGHEAAIKAIEKCIGLYNEKYGD